MDAKVDFRNTLILLTSNLGSAPLLALEDGETVEQARGAVMEEVQAAFRPEFLNRLDSVLLFQRLSREHMSSIVDIQMAGLQTTACRQGHHDLISAQKPGRGWLIKGMIRNMEPGL